MMGNNDEECAATTEVKDDAGPDIELFESWVKKHYGESSRTKTITNQKYSRICQLIRGEDSNTNAKFRFWVRSKGFRLISHDKTTDKVTDDPSGALFVSLHAKEDSVPIGEKSIESFLRTNLPAISFFRKVAMVEEFYDIIKRAHVDDKGVHAGQKKTYRVVSDTYAFLPREVITFYLLNCNTCKPRIQKYGPIHSKVKTHNLPICKLNLEKCQDKVESYGRETLGTNQVIRPSPKRYMPTPYHNELLLKEYEEERGNEIADISSSHSINRVKYYKREESIHHSHNIDVIRRSDHLVFQDNFNLRNNREQRDQPGNNRDALTFSSIHPSPDDSNSLLNRIIPSDQLLDGEYFSREEVSPTMGGIRDDDIDRMKYEERDEMDMKKLISNRNSVSPSYSEFSTCTRSCCSQVTPSYDYNRYRSSDRLYRYRREPYKLLQKSENLRNYDERILEAQHSKEKYYHSYSIPYFTDNKDRYINLYRRETDMEVPPYPTNLRKTLLANDVTDSRWTALGEQGRDEKHLEYSYRCTIGHS